jgi:hypothetical protein
MAAAALGDLCSGSDSLLVGCQILVRRMRRRIIMANLALRVSLVARDLANIVLVINGELLKASL